MAMLANAPLSHAGSDNDIDHTTDIVIRLDDSNATTISNNRFRGDGGRFE